VIGFTASSFDLLHAGHIEMLKECKENCDYLIVGLNLNPTNKATVQSAMERYTQLQGCKYIDEIIPYESEQDLENLLLLKRIDRRFLGEDYKHSSRDVRIGLNFTGSQLDIEIYYNDRKHKFSTSELKERCKTS